MAYLGADNQEKAIYHQGMSNLPPRVVDQENPSEALISELLDSIRFVDPATFDRLEKSIQEKFARFDGNPRFLRVQMDWETFFHKLGINVRSPS